MFLYHHPPGTTAKAPPIAPPPQPAQPLAVWRRGGLGKECRRKIERRQTEGFPTLFGKGPDGVADPFRNVPCSCFTWPRMRKRTNRKNPRKIVKIPKELGKSQKRQKNTNWKGRVQIGNPPPLETPHQAALENSFLLSQ